jgi:hypothetical protein
MTTYDGWLYYQRRTSVYSVDMTGYVIIVGRATCSKKGERGLEYDVTCVMTLSYRVCFRRQNVDIIKRRKPKLITTKKTRKVSIDL